MVQFELVKHKFPNKTALLVYLYGFQITQSETIHNVPAHQQPQYYQTQWVIP